MRQNKRPNDALRPVTIERNYTRHAEGSVLVCFGDTKVICTASVDDRVPPFLKDTGKGWITAEYAMLPRSTHSRIPRDKNKKGRALEISRLIGRSLRSIAGLEALGERQIVIDCDVIQADGGTRTASITGAFVALRDALSTLVASGDLDQIPIIGNCAAVSCGIIDGEVLLDLCYEEDSEAEVDMNIVMRDDGTIIEIQGTAEKGAFSRKQLDEMVDVGEKGINELISLQREVSGCE